MTTVHKVKVSVTISSDLLEEIDHAAQKNPELNRSKVIDLWLRRAAHMAAAKSLEQDTIAYYTSLRAKEIDEDKKWSQTTSSQFASLDID